jgi:hypothetical protein
MRFLVLPCSDLPTWKRLISHQPSRDERVLLVASIFSDRDEAKVVGRLSGNDAQTFIDIVDEVSSGGVQQPLLRQLALDPSHFTN